MTGMVTVLALACLVAFAVAAWRVQTAPTTGTRVAAGCGGAAFGILGIVLLALVIWG